MLLYDAFVSVMLPTITLKACNSESLVLCRWTLWCNRNGPARLTEWCSRFLLLCCNNKLAKGIVLVYIYIYIYTGVYIYTVYHRCQPSRNRAGNPAFLLLSRIFARTFRIFVHNSRVKLEDFRRYDANCSPRRRMSR